jgi:hypothetical protein
VLYFQLLKEYLAKYFSARTIICVQVFAPQYNCRLKQTFDYSARTTAPAVAHSSHLGVRLSWILHIDCVFFIDYFRPGAVRLHRLCPPHDFHVSSKAADKKLSAPLSTVNYYLLPQHPIFGCCHYIVTANTLDYLDTATGYTFSA